MLTAIALVGAVFHATQANAAEPTFALDSEFLQIPADSPFAACSACALDRQGQLYVLHRGKVPIRCFGTDGKLVRAWGDDVFGTGHGLRVDPEGNVWATDIKQHQVFKFSPEGKLLLAVGKAGQAGDDAEHFDRPTDIAFGPKGEFYVTDGYGNNRVAQFDARGVLIRQWGKKGHAAGEFNLPHAILRDAAGRLYVGDRENDRVQVFDSEGKWLETWPGFAPYGLAFGPEGTFYVADVRASQILQIDSHGKVFARWGRKGAARGEFGAPHMLAADGKGRLYVAEVDNKRVQRMTFGEGK
ncbi:MAG TPA: peptidyl-alpha-hydroxyglycine alpha-amidating lyase family protein [Planctomycetaceae bacterium]|nr:peptidyl-alpha-hydroxyglycine alpha-amidating lyase family protein [Planctomycetaceae bacterium]